LPSLLFVRTEIFSRDGDNTETMTLTLASTFDLDRGISHRARRAKPI